MISTEYLELLLCNKLIVNDFALMVFKVLLTAVISLRSILTDLKVITLCFMLCSDDG